MLAGFGLGLLLAAQVGPVTLLVIRSILRGGRALVVGLAMAVAIAGIDVLYATLGLVGAGKLTSGADVRLVLGLASAAILCTIGLRTMWNGLRARMGLESAADVVSARRAFATAIAATALNPLTIALWTVSFPAAAPNAAESTAGNGAALLLGVAAGTLLWYSGFSTVVAVGGRFLGPRLLPAVEVATGGGLVLFGSLLGLRAVEDR